MPNPTTINPVLLYGTCVVGNPVLTDGQQYPLRIDEHGYLNLTGEGPPVALPGVPSQATPGPAVTGMTVYRSATVTLTDHQQAPLLSDSSGNLVNG